MKYKFEIIYANKNMKQVTDFLNKCDLNIGKIGKVEVMTFNSENELSIKEVKETIKEAYESCECEVLNIEGGKVE